MADDGEFRAVPESELPAVVVPAGLRMGGETLWRSVCEHHILTEVQRVQLLEACRMKDRLDALDLILTGDVDTWATLTLDLNGEVYVLRINAALQRANDTANSMKQLIAALRLPDEGGRVPQRRGPRGAQAPTVPGGAVKPPSDLDRARRLAAERRAAASE